MVAPDSTFDIPDAGVQLPGFKSQLHYLLPHDSQTVI